MRTLFLTILTILLILPAAPALAAPQDAVVKIYTTARILNYDTPWQIAGFTSINGSGCLIAGRRILTNAHVVSNANHIEVQRHGTAVRYPAKVVAISHEADLALLTVADPAFAAGVTPLEFGELPEILDSIIVFGFPEGGEGLSVTKGIVSRIEEVSYIHSIVQMLGLQVDAAINGGNSGGPALKDGRIVGIAMQVKPKSENIGYLVSPPVIAHFLKDLEDGRYDGFPELGIDWQTLDSPALRAAVGLPDNDGGVYLGTVIPGSAADGVLRRGDVLLAIDGQPVASDGSVLLRPGLRVAMEHLIESHQMGEAAALTVWRQGRREELTVRLHSRLNAGAVIIPPEYDVDPEYYIAGGVVLLPLSVNYLQTWGDKWLTEAPSSLLVQMERFRERPGEQVVVVSSLLASAMTSGYSGLEYRRIVTVNGRPFVSFQELATRLDAALAGSAPILLGTENGEVIAILPQQHREQIGELLETYGISRAKRVRGEGGL